MPPAIKSDSAYRTVVTNDDGDWTIRKQHADGTQGSGPAPGAITRHALPDGTVILEDPFLPGHLNDPVRGGVGAFGFHLARQNGEPEVYNRTWDVTTRHHAPSSAGFGVAAVRIADGPRAATVNGGACVVLVVEVDLQDHYCAPGRPLCTVRYEWFVFGSRCQANVIVVVREGAGDAFPAFVKEPKLVAHSLGNPVDGSPKYETVDCYDAGGALLFTKDLRTLPDPNVRTFQIANDTRCRLRFQSPSTPASPHAFNVVARGMLPEWTRVAWTSEGAGLNYWALRSDGRPQMEPCDPDEDYCKQFGASGDLLTRQWEIARYTDPAKPQTGVMLHGWEGGSGYPDCRCCYRPLVPGEVYRNWLCVSYGSGWVV